MNEKNKADKNKADDKLSDALKSAGATEGLPDGFQRVNPEWGARAYCKPAEGMEIRGVLIGLFTRRSGLGGDYFQVRVSQDTPAVDADKKAIVCKKGDILCIDKRSALEDLMSWVDRDFPVEVYIAFREKMDLDGGRTWWRTDVGARQAPRSVLNDLGIPL